MSNAAAISDILIAFSGNRCPLNNEKTAQVCIADMLASRGYNASREHRLSAADILDFFLPDIGLVIEVKLKGAQKVAVFKQLERYADHPEVKAIMLATNLAMGLPSYINDKPTYYVSLGAAWL